MKEECDGKSYENYAGLDDYYGVDEFERKQITWCAYASVICLAVSYLLYILLGRA